MAKAIALAILHQGLVRKHNEDNLFLLDAVAPASRRANYEHSAVSSDGLQIYAVADGRGGPGIGDAAALAALRIIDQQRKRLRPGNRLDFPIFARETLDLANRSICDLLAPYEGLPVGTTLSLLAIDRDTAYTLSLGNSRIYLFRDGLLSRLTVDHDNPLPDRSRLSRYRGLFDDDLSPDDVSMTRTELKRGDVFLIATDGLIEVVDDTLLSNTLADPSAFVQQIRNLRTLGLERGGNDNMALIGIRIQDPQMVAAPSKPKKRFWLAGRPYAGPHIRGSADFLANSRLRGLLRPVFFFLAFVLLGILLGKLVVSVPVWLKILFN